MKRVARNGFIVLLSGLFIVMLISHIRSVTVNNDTEICDAVLGDLLTQLEDGSAHPFCRPVSEALYWEEDSAFLELCGQYGAILRVSAFEIMLPDPLPGEKSNVVLAADLLAGTVVKPGETFSLNRAVGPYSLERGFKEGPGYSGDKVIDMVGGGVCKIATTLYNAAILANLKIMERHAHGMLADYVPPGQDATVSYGALDFSFNNNTAQPLIIWADTAGDALAVAMYGSTYPPRVTWHHELLSWQKRQTTYRNNTNLLPGEERTIAHGSDHVTVKSWLTIEEHDGTLTTKDLGVDYYRSRPRIIEKIFLE